MSPRALLPAAALAGLLLIAPARAQDEACARGLGRGWPPATENYGTAAERLFAAGAAPALSLTRLPPRGTESALLLIPGEGAGDWTVRRSEADERIDAWNGGRRELRVGQQPDVAQAPIPAALAQRVVAQWRRALAGLVPQDRAAQYHDGETLLFVVGGERVAGPAPRCGAGALLLRQAELMNEAADEEDEDDRAELWRDLAESLDELERTLAGAAG
ncbi:hypothetical protein [Vulcaniibacterium tengchongense]|uniref:Uncharacterized protein n=1 Tax=Vulcaniibacterium tengchongense TaxID=1273429 RepID=A0A3N4VF97_9GAMM|nr:hypothetical protein [Vulcaniibacterium tengchongense]RPE75847.1 hypothetical protein EDC50_2744 [Vulcaniibacterium tengchongense]